MPTKRETVKSKAAKKVETEPEIRMPVKVVEAPRVTPLDARSVSVDPDRKWSPQ